jgi:tetratricopeptide (TPR) repeat protein
MNDRRQAVAEPADLLDAAAEDEWARLRSQLELAEGFWCAFVFSPSPRQVDVIRERAERLIGSRVQRVLVVQPRTPAELASGVVPRLLGPEADDSALVWVQAVRVDVPGAGRPWEAAWEHLLLRLNERRDAIRRHVPGGLTLALHTSMKPLVRDAAPDLWSVRSLVIEIQPETGRAFPDRGLTDRRSAPPGGAVGLVGSGQITSRTARANESRRLLDKSEASLRAGNVESSMVLARQAIALLQEEGDRQGVAAALAQLSAAEEADDDRAAAEEHAERALALVETSDTQLVGALLERLSSLSEGRGDLAAAERYAERCVQWWRRRAATTGDTQSALRGLLAAMSQLGWLRADQGDGDAARSIREQALQLARRVAAPDGGSPEALRDLYRAVRDVGDSLFHQGDLAGAGVAYEESLGLARRLVERWGDTPQALRDLSYSLDQVGDVALQRGDLAAADAAYAEAAALRTRTS